MPSANLRKASRFFMTNLCFTVWDASLWLIWIQFKGNVIASYINIHVASNLVSTIGWKCYIAILHGWELVGIENIVGKKKRKCIASPFILVE